MATPRVYVVESKNSLHDWSPAQLFIARWAAEVRVKEHRDFMKLNAIKGVYYRFKPYFPLGKKSDERQDYAH
jgi:hypothetical protein